MLKFLKKWDYRMREAILSKISEYTYSKVVKFKDSRYHVHKGHYDKTKKK